MLFHSRKLQIYIFSKTTAKMNKVSDNAMALPAEPKHIRAD